jgi:hypothetical protein
MKNTYKIYTNNFSRKPWKEEAFLRKCGLRWNMKIYIMNWT